MTEQTTSLLESVISENLEMLKETDHDNENRRKITAETCELLDRLTEAEGKQMEFWDKEDRRELEREKNESMVQIEQEKNVISKPKMILEIARIVVPVVVPMIAYGIYQKRLLEFEETGRVNSTAGRELHLPKFFK